MPADGGPFEQVTKFPEGGLFIEEPKLSPARGVSDGTRTSDLPRDRQMFY
jgi:hypothetical protein